MILRAGLFCGCCLLALAGCTPPSPDAAPPVLNASGPRVGAPYAVGSRTVFIHDPSRPYDAVGGVNDGIRTLVTELWYPVDHAEAETGNYRHARYGDYVFGDREVHRLMMTQTTFFHLTPDSVRPGVSDARIDEAIGALFQRERGSLLDAPLARIDEALPVVVMSHGDAGSRYNMETLVEHLAAQGYFVIAPEHTGNSPFSMSGRDPALAKDPAFAASMKGVVPYLSARGTYGETENFGQSDIPFQATDQPIRFLSNLDRSLMQRINDLRATIAYLDQLDSLGFAGAEPGFLDLQNLGLVGRSYGGLTTLVGLALEDRFVSGFAVVSPMVIGLNAQIPADSELWRSGESVFFNRDRPTPMQGLQKPMLLLNGAEDRLIIGFEERLASLTGSAAPSVDQPFPALRTVFDRSEAPAIWAMLADTHHASLAVSGAYWWPDLKPDRAQRHFQANSDFRLLNPVVAHEIQKQLAQQFFDWTLRGDEAALERLSTQPENTGELSLELRNF